MATTTSAFRLLVAALLWAATFSATMPSVLVTSPAVLSFEVPGTYGFLTNGFRQAFGGDDCVTKIESNGKEMLGRSEYERVSFNSTISDVTICMDNSREAYVKADNETKDVKFISIIRRDDPTLELKLDLTSSVDSFSPLGQCNLIIAGVACPRCGVCLADEDALGIRASCDTRTNDMESDGISAVRGLFANDNCVDITTLLDADYEGDSSTTSGGARVSIARMVDWRAGTTFSGMSSLIFLITFGFVQ